MRKLSILAIATALSMAPTSVQRADAQGFFFLLGTVAVPCTSTGILDFSNVCNDIYFMAGL